jgi:hypothetical protein
LANPLFSTYSQGENRITASILAVFERLSFALVERILQALCQEPEVALLTFSNQPSGPVSKPDGRIRASFAYWIETKRIPQAVNVEQVLSHLKALEADIGVERKRLLVLTPDTKIPLELDKLKDNRVAWASFDDLLAIIREVVEPGSEWLVSDRAIPTEQEKAILRELVRFLVSEDLVGRATERVVVVAAKIALQEWLNYSVYMCQPHRTFQPSSRLAFYANGRIDRRIPAILTQVESVVLSEEGVRAQADLPESARRKLLDLVKSLEKKGSDRSGSEAKVIFLSDPGASETLNLPQDIVNDLITDSGRPVAFTQGQRYIPLSRLERGPKTTSELLESLHTFVSG